MLHYVIRCTLDAQTGDGEYSKFPFDTLTAKVRIELSHFKIEDTNYRFDVYAQPN